jgi:cell wall-associated NlpC family hydrolase
VPARISAVAHALRALLTLTVIAIAGGLVLLTGTVVAARPAGAATRPVPTPAPAAQPRADASPSGSSGGSSSAAPAPTSWLHMAKQRTVTRGIQVHVFARLTTRHRPAAGTMIRFYRRHHDNRSWSYVGHARTTRKGFAQLPWFVRHSAQWMARVGHHRSIASEPQHDYARSLGRSAVRIAATRRGDPYVYGASGPNRFDCSGLTRYVFGRLGISLPHNAAAQSSRVHHVNRHHKAVGDLIFFHSGSGHVYHVAIYAGHGMMWHAPHSGDHVRKQRIFSGSYYVGRIRG